MPNFKRLTTTDEIKEIIQSAFDTSLDISGSWGDTLDGATIISSTNNISIILFEHKLSSMRAYVEMNMTLPKEDRYGSINVNELRREEIRENDKIYDKVTYEISAMREDRYALFIDEYKDGYGKDWFDIDEHFRNRKLATLIREEVYWFDVTNISTT
ncbi:MAG: hypothetical protein QM493_04190 [Sulfurovum sp.]